MYRQVATAFVLLLLSGTELGAHPQLPKLKEKISKLLAGDYGDENPLASEELASFACSPVLYFLRGSADLAYGTRNNDTDTLRSALSDLDRAHHRWPDEERITNARLTAIRELARAAHDQKQHFVALKAIAALPPAELEAPDWVKRYAHSLWATGQKTVLRRLIAATPASFQWIKDDPAFAGFSPPELKLGDNSQTKDERIKDRQSDTEKAREWFKANKTHFFDSKHHRRFEPILAKYVTLKTKQQRLSKEEHELVKIVERQTKYLPPKILSKLIIRAWSASLFDEALQLAETFTSNYPHDPEFARVQWFRGRLLEDVGQRAEAITAFDQNATALLGTEHAMLSGYRAAILNQWQKPDAKSSRYRLQQFLNHFPKTPYGDIVQYHLSRTDAKTAKDYIRDNPLSFYSLLLLKHHKFAATQLTGQFTKSDRTLERYVKNHRIFPASIANAQDLKVYQELTDLDLNEWRLIALKRLLKKHLKSLPWQMYAVHELIDQKEVSESVLQMARAVGNYDEVRGLISWERLFPEYEKAMITEVLGKLRSPLPYHLVVAVMRQESAFDPHVRSHANAYGLMQLLPRTARNMADQIGIKDFDLLNPKDNATLGISYVEYLLDRYQGNLVHTLSAYNAGPYATDRWLAARKSADPLEFIQLVPYQETRTFIGLVLRNYWLYQLLYGTNGDFEVSYEIDMPASVRSSERSSG